MATQNIETNQSTLCSTCKNKIVNEKIKCVNDACYAYYHPSCAKGLKDRSDCKVCRKVLTPVTTPLNTLATPSETVFEFDITKYQLNFDEKINQLTSKLDSKITSIRHEFNKTAESIKSLCVELNTDLGKIVTAQNETIKNLQNNVDQNKKAIELLNTNIENNNNACIQHSIKEIEDRFARKVNFIMFNIAESKSTSELVKKADDIREFTNIIKSAESPELAEIAEPMESQEEARNVETFTNDLFHQRQNKAAARRLQNSKRRLDESYEKRGEKSGYKRGDIPHLMAYYQNTRSIKCKNNTVKLVSQTCKYDVIALTETWLREYNYTGEYFDLQMHHVNRADRNNTYKTSGGGCLIALSNVIQPADIQVPDRFNENFISIDLSLSKCFHHGVKIVLACVYIPPNTSTYTCKQFFNSLYNLLVNCKSDLLIVGDFNMPNLNEVLNCTQSDSKVDTLINFINLLNLTQYNQVSSLDLVLSTLECHVAQSMNQVVDVELCHPPLDIIAILPTRHHVAPSQFKCCNKINFKKLNYDNVVMQLYKADWDGLYNVKNVNLAVELFYTIINNTLQDMTGKCTQGCCKCIENNNSTASKRCWPHWFSHNLISIINLKHNIRTKISKLKHKINEHLLYNNNNNYNDLNLMSLNNEVKILMSKYKLINNQVRSLHKHEYNNFLNNTENTLTSEPASLWNYINKTRGTSRLPEGFVIDNQEITDTRLINDAFAVFFNSTYENMSADDSTTLSNIIKSNNKYIDLELIGNTDVFTELEIENVIKKLQSKYSAGLDEYPNVFVKNCAKVLVKPLTHIFNLALRTGTYPDMWKCAKVVPVFKSGDKNIIQNYRPISILSSFSKVMEMCLYNKILGLFTSVVSIHQHGFLPGRSITTNLVSLNNYIYKALANKKQVDVIYTDFSKAFDKINLIILINKLKGLGLSGRMITLMTSYLLERQSCVVCHGQRSSPFVPQSGVPQGSNLGPLLFLIYINDVTLHVSCPILLYADDIKLYNIVESTTDALNLQHSIVRFYDWCLNNKMKLNIDKCKVMTCHKIRAPIIVNYTLNNVPLSRVDNTLDLGILYDSTFNFNLHIANTSNKATRILGFLSRICQNFKKPNTFSVLYKAYVLPTLEYGTLALPFRCKKHKKILEKVQKEYLKKLIYKTNGVYPTRGTEYTSLCKLTNTNTLETRRLYITAIFCIKLIQGLIDCPVILDDIPIWVHRNNNNRSNTILYPPNISNAFELGSPIYNITNSINTLTNLNNSFDLFNVPSSITISYLSNIFGNVKM